MADGAEDPRRGPLDTGTERYQKLKQTQVPRDEQEVPLEYQKLVEPHVASFNYFIGEGLQNVVESLQPVEVRAASIHTGGVGVRRLWQRTSPPWAVGARYDGRRGPLRRPVSSYRRCCILQAHAWAEGTHAHSTHAAHPQSCMGKRFGQRSLGGVPADTSRSPSAGPCTAAGTNACSRVCSPNTYKCTTPRLPWTAAHPLASHSDTPHRAHCRARSPPPTQSHPTPVTPSKPPLRPLHPPPCTLQPPPPCPHLCATPPPPPPHLLSTSLPFSVPILAPPPPHTGDAPHHGPGHAHLAQRRARGEAGAGRRGGAAAGRRRRRRLGGQQPHHAARLQRGGEWRGGGGGRRREEGREDVCQRPMDQVPIVKGTSPNPDREGGGGGGAEGGGGEGGGGAGGRREEEEE